MGMASMEMTSPIPALAAYLTSGRLVTKHSIGIQMGGIGKVEADEFFTLRAAFGVAGYMTADEALEAINRMIGEET